MDKQSLLHKAIAIFHESFAVHKDSIELLQQNLDAFFTAALTIKHDKELERFMPESSFKQEFAGMRLLHVTSVHEIVTFEPRVSAEMLMIVVETGVTARVILKNSSNLVPAGIVGIVQEDASLELMLDNDLKSATAQTFERWHLAKNATLTFFETTTGSGFMKAHKEFYLKENAELTFTSLMALRSTEQYALTTKQIHQGAASKSSVLVKSVLQDASKSFYRGIIIIQEDAQQSQADQQQKALILSSDAKTCAIPSLEVATNDVRCNHGSAAGRFNETERAYLLSRGFDEKDAYDLLLQGFFNEPLLNDYSEGEALRDRLIDCCR